MVKGIVKFGSLKDINKFVTEASKCDFCIDIKRGSKILDGKSIEGLCILQLNLELECILHTNIANTVEFTDKIKEFIVEDFEQM